MKWDEIYDKSKAIVRQVIGQVLDEESQGNFEGMENIVKHLQDSDYLAGELKKRERYDYQEAFHNLKQGERRRKRLRILMITSRAACVLAVASLLVYQWNKQDRQQVKLAENKMMPARGMKAVLLKASGDELQLDEHSLRVEGDNGVVMAVDSSGLQYEVITDLPVKELEYNTLIVPRGGEFSLELADGTRVWLNAESRLRYPVAFTGKERKVEMEGEVYFEVAKNKEKPFIVTVNGVDIRVLGTSFNVSAYQEDVVTTLVEGKVQLKKGNEQVILSPNQQAIWSDDEFRVKQVDARNFVLWKEGVFYFEDVDLETILDDMARWYNVNVFYMNPALKEMKFSVEIRRYGDINEILRRIEQTKRVKFEIKIEL